VARRILSHFFGLDRPEPPAAVAQSDATDTED
jgi:hypothetical protein